METESYTGVPLRDAKGFDAFATEIGDTEWSPWNSASLLDNSRQAVRFLHARGALKGEALPSDDAPLADHHEWLLAVRPRSSDYLGFLDHLKGLYATGAEIPEPLAAIVTTHVTADEAEHPSPATNEPLLLPLPANEQQRKILELAATSAGVAVQGPPGTGKSHTIANLISHYVAHGKRVLVVSEKEQALRVLSEKIPEEIRGLTVSVLGADKDSLRQLESSVREITSRAGSIGIEEREEIRRIVEQREENRLHAAAAANQIMLSQSREATPFPVPHLQQTLTPVKAAEWVRQHESEYGYIPDRVSPETACPLTAHEYKSMCHALQNAPWGRLEQASGELPDLTLVPTPEERIKANYDIHHHHQVIEQHAEWIKDWSQIDAMTPEEVFAIAEFWHHEHELQKKAEGTALERELRAQMADPMFRPLWETFLTQLRAEQQTILSLRTRTAAHVITLPETLAPNYGQVLAKAVATLREKGKLGRFNTEAKTVLSECSIDGYPPTTPETAQLCLDEWTLRLHRQMLRTRWANQMGPLGVSPLVGQRPEDIVNQKLANLEELFAMGERWRAAAEGLLNLGLVVNPRPGIEAASHNETLANLAYARKLIADRQNALNSAFALLERESTPNTPLAHHWTALKESFHAIPTRDTQGQIVDPYAEAFERIQQLRDAANAARRTINSWTRLHAATPIWATQLRETPHDAPAGEHLLEAWTHAQLRTLLTTVAHEESPQQAADEYHRLQEEGRKLTLRLVELKAWTALSDSLTQPQRAALAAYVQAVKQFGKTGGKYAARRKANLRDSLAECQTAVPVWIMTTNRALQQLRPDSEPAYDILIVDEASQIGISGIPLLGLAKKAIIVGDDKQTSPENVGNNLQTLFDTMERHLSNIKLYETLFDPNNSLYDVAVSKFPNTVMLTEHFRCLPEIISFSSRIAYDGNIQPLRDRKPTPDWKPLGAIKVLDGYRTGDKNPAEITVVTDLIARMMNDPSYNGMTIGVISLLSGGNQSRSITEAILRHPNIDNSEWLDERKGWVGEAAGFQGDERDIIIITTVVAPGSDQHVDSRVRVGAASKNADLRRINVAASRAKNQMWIVHTLDPEDFPSTDYRADLIRHCRDTSPLDLADPYANAPNPLEHAESDFEERVIKQLQEHGYKQIISQYKVGAANRSYRIDIVVEGPHSRLAIECDGEQWHGPDQWHADFARQQVLERAGWTFQRIRGSDFYRNPDEAMKPVYQQLDSMGIPPRKRLARSPSRQCPPSQRNTRQRDRQQQITLTHADTAKRASRAEGAPKCLGTRRQPPRQPPNPSNPTPLPSNPKPTPTKTSPHNSKPSHAHQRHHPRRRHPQS